MKNLKSWIKRQVKRFKAWHDAEGAKCDNRSIEEQEAEEGDPFKCPPCITCHGRGVVLDDELGQIIRCDCLRVD